MLHFAEKPDPIFRETVRCILEFELDTSESKTVFYIKSSNLFL
jgi:hypothetical protein